jgi:hypothetical protein
LIIIWFLSEFFSTSNVIMRKRKGGSSEVGKFMEKLRGDEVVRPGGGGREREREVEKRAKQDIEKDDTYFQHHRLM